MTLRELYHANERWGKDTMIRLKYYGKGGIDISVCDAVKEYGDYYVCGFLNDVVEVARKRTEVWTGGIGYDI